MAIPTANEWGVGFTALATGLAAFALSGVQPFAHFSTACIAIGSICFIAGIVFIGHAVINTPLALRLLARHSALNIEASTDYLSHVVTTVTDLLNSDYYKRQFAVLKVTNNGSRNLANLVAGGRFNRGAEERCIWSLDSGDHFTAGGSHSASLNVGDSRLLVVAQGFGVHKLWARLPSQQPFGWPPSMIDLEGTTSYVDLSRKAMSIAGDVMIAVRFAAEGLDPVERHFRLDFDGDTPRITPLTRRAAAKYKPAPPDTTPPLSAIEQLHEWERSVDEMQKSAGEKWNDFFAAAGETVSQFRAIRVGENPPPDQKWETFKRTAAHASRLSTRLPESDSEQARALVRPFLDLEQGNLESCVTAANELQSFILKRQAGVQPNSPAESEP